MVNLLDLLERENKYKHGKHFYKQQKYFSPFSLSVDSMLIKKDLSRLANLSGLMVKKLKEPI